MEKINMLFSSQITETLGWTVLHSLWQSGLIAALLLLSFVALKRTSAKVRYRMAGSAMLTVLLASIMTFFYFFNVEKEKDLSIFVIERNSEAATPILINIPESTSSFSFFSNYFEQHLPLIVAIWLVGMGFFLLRLIGGFAYVHYLKNNKIKAVTDYWQLKSDALREKIPVQQSVAILESTLVKVPMTIGYLKPIILLPVGLINHLSLEQTEAVLAHELAHIARKDYLFNILQSVMEVLFYFNPAVWLISSHIRRERENCCDDIAVRVCGNSLNYVKALVSVEEVSKRLPHLAMAFSNNKNHLIMRVQRILKQPQKKSRLGERLIAALFILTTFGLFAFQQKEASSSNVIEVISQLEANKSTSSTIEIIEEEKPTLKTKVIVIKQDTIPVGQKNRVRIKTNVNGKRMMLETKNGEIDGLMVNNRVINPKDYGKYEKEIAQLLEESKNVTPPPPPPSLKGIAVPPARPAPAADLDKIPPPPPPALSGLNEIPAPPSPTAPPAPRQIKVRDVNGTAYLQEENRKEMKKRIEAEEKKRAAMLVENIAEHKQKIASSRQKEAEEKAAKLRRKMEVEKINAKALASASEELRTEQTERMVQMEEEILLQKENLEVLAEHRKVIEEQRKAMLLQAEEYQRQVIHAEKANEKTTRIEEELKKDGLY
ncbi:MAG: bla regulator protein BlaR1, partial [Saprospiraceae bacterium]